MGGGLPASPPLSTQGSGKVGGPDSGRLTQVCILLLGTYGLGPVTSPTPHFLEKGDNSTYMGGGGWGWEEDALMRIK